MISLLRSVTFLATGKKEEVLARVKRRIGSPNEAQAKSTLFHGEVALDLLTRRFLAAASQAQTLSMTSRQESLRCWTFFLITLGKSFPERSYSQVFGA